MGDVTPIRRHDDGSDGPRFPVWDPQGRGPHKDHVLNTRALLDHYGASIRYNLMKHDFDVTITGFKLAAERRADGTMTWIENRAAEHGLSRAPVFKHLVEIADEYHPVRQWLRTAPWDGSDRVEALIDSVELRPEANRELCRLLIRRWLLGAVAAVLPEFEQRFVAQGVLVAQGEQSRGKTRWLRSLAPPVAEAQDWVLSGETLDPSDRDSTQRATSTWLCELGEVDATFNKSDIAALKSFLTRATDTYRSAYARREEHIVRRTVFFASVNDPVYLVDHTGNRRWWTVPVERCHPDHGVDLQQVWAQLAAEVEGGGRWWLDDAELEQLNAANRDHEPDDALAAEVRDTWQANDWPGVPGVSLATICRALPSLATRTPTPGETKRITSALRAIGVKDSKTKYGRVYMAAKAQ